MTGLGVLVVGPTYDEAHSLPSLVARLRKHVPDADVLVVDDNSPDGTGAVADVLATTDDRLRVLHRTAKNGLGAAYLAGFRWGLGRGYDTLVEMDADGSHQPEQLPSLLEALRSADVVIGSRWVAGGGVVDWPRRRELLSRGGNRYAQLVLGLGVHDATAGYRAYRATALERLDLPSVNSQGYCFQVDLTRRAASVGLRIVEVPIEFVERQVGTSKMDTAIVAEALWRITTWGLVGRARQLAGRRRAGGC